MKMLRSDPLAGVQDHKKKISIIIYFFSLARFNNGTSGEVNNKNIDEDGRGLHSSKMRMRDREPLQPVRFWPAFVCALVARRN